MENPLFSFKSWTRTPPTEYGCGKKKKKFLYSADFIFIHCLEILSNLLHAETTIKILKQCLFIISSKIIFSLHIHTIKK